MQDYKDSNLKFWDSIVEDHVRSDFYDVSGFLQGKTTLDSVEINQVGDVSGLTFLHLQCHFGLSTLDWVRLGAIATGVDFSPTAIAMARKLSKDTGLRARFVESNVYNISSRLDEKFDIVFTSYGVLCWLPDLTKWAEQIAHCLKTGGRFYLVE
ncbi:MAG: class I SAM-dependent methyltransferase, partial [Chloroflexota bacterium]|nr:class I SAM-dependent methyltransferase [Chloroflexota bacterium]